jgi:protein SCO1/2
MNRRAMHPTLPIRSIVRPLAAALLLALSACSGGGSAAGAGDPPLAGAAIGGDFTLVDKAGKPVRYADFAGKYRVLYFGYTFCPDVCPLDLQNLMKGYRTFAKAHGDLAAKIQPIFVSIDPARDKPAIMGQYTAAFGPQLLGLTGTPDQVAVAAKAFAVYYQKRDGSSPDAYLMDHSRAAYLMDPQGKPLALLPVDKDGASVAAELAKWVH